MPRRSYQKGSALYLAVALSLLVLFKMVVFTEQPVLPVVESTVAVQHQPAIAEKQIMVAEPESLPEKPSFGPPMDLEMTAPMIPLDAYQKEMEQQQPAWSQNAVTTTHAPKHQPRVVIIIDDMGMDRKHTRAVMDLPGPLTLAFLPYAGDIKNQSEYGRSKGHELMVHVPMEPIRESTDVGPSPLRAGMSVEEFDRVLQEDLNAFDGYVGINNHMGSKLTQDRASMALVMQELKKRGLLFVDSRTINTSVATEEAEKHGLPYAVRDIFIDHEETYEAASDALDQLEKKALKSGLAIAIGHPKEKTIQALQQWLPTLQEKGIALVPVSAAVHVPVGTPENAALR